MALKLPLIVEAPIPPTADGFLPVRVGPSRHHRAIEIVDDHPEPCNVCDKSYVSTRPGVVWALVMGWGA
jgi:hypothetical protein